MRFTLRRLTYFCAVLLLLALVYSSIFYEDNIYNLYQKHVNKVEYSESSFAVADYITRRDLHFSNYEFSGYRKFIKTINVENFEKLSVNDRCQVFFNHFQKENALWSLQYYDFPSYDKDITNKAAYFKKSSDLFLKHRGKHYTIKSRDNVTIERDYHEMVARTKLIEQGMADTMTLFRLYGKCFIQNTNTKMKGAYDNLTKKFFQPLSRLPKFLIDNVILEENSIPSFDESNVFKGDVIKMSENDNMISFINHNLNGKGILISAANRHSKDVERLIRVLRALNNKLPIQIFHRNDLSARAQDQIKLVATTDIEHLLDPVSKHFDHKPELDLLKEYQNYGSEFPKQQVFFVDTSKTLEHDQRRTFSGYSNKLLALMLCSFEEVIILDADTVPLVSIESFFESEKYKLGGAYFFKDRTIRDYNNWIETNYFTKLMPSHRSSIDWLFGMRVTDKTLKNRYMTGWRHLQEAGVVVINKKKHFTGILASMFLLLWKEPVKSSVWGEKELYWLGLSLVGDEGYEFNEHAAGSVGQISSDPRYKYYPNSDSVELCSSHPGHVDKNGKLLWINSGVDHCKKNGYFPDFQKFPLLKVGSMKVMAMYNNPLDVGAIVIPPDLPTYRESGSPFDLTKELKFEATRDKTKLDYDEIDRKLDINQFMEWGPQKGWVKNSICTGYQYCAYDSIEPYGEAIENERFRKGKVIQLDDEAIRNYQYLAKIWYIGGTRLTENKKE